MTRSSSRSLWAAFAVAIAVALTRDVHVAASTSRTNLPFQPRGRSFGGPRAYDDSSSPLLLPYRRRSGGSLAAHFPVGLGGTIICPAKDDAVARLRGGGRDIEGGDDDDTVDNGAILKYFAATVVQLTLMNVFLEFIDALLRKFDQTPPLPAVGAFFYLLSLRSRIFNPLDNSRPKRRSGEDAEEESTDAGFRDRIMPNWTPPRFIFPIMWLLIIGPMRAYSSVLVYEAGGKKFAHDAILSLCLHLTMGDLWNTINNAEKRYGFAVVGVGAVVASWAYAAIEYYKVSPRAGYVLGGTGLWLLTAAKLIRDTWKLNPRPDGSLDPLYPIVGEAKTKFQWFQKTEEEA